MGFFYTWHGRLGPSDSYLEDHPDFLFFDDGDEWDDDYDVWDDPDVLCIERICEKCGRSYTIESLHNDFTSDILKNLSVSGEYEGQTAISDHLDHLCGHCAAELYTSMVINGSIELDYE